MAFTGYQIGGMIVIIIGIILLIAGIIILAIDQSNQKTSEWWVWALIVIGVIALLVGICLFFIPSPIPSAEDIAKSKDYGCDDLGYDMGDNLGYDAMGYDDIGYDVPYDATKKLTPEVSVQPLTTQSAIRNEGCPPTHQVVDVQKVC